MQIKFSVSKLFNQVPRRWAQAVCALTLCLAAPPNAVTRQAHAQTYPADAGLVDVTKAPYNAPRGGTLDAAPALQRALDENISSNRILYLPNGTYRLSRGLSFPLRGYGMLSMHGQSRTGVILRLDNAAIGFENAGAPQALLDTGYQIGGGADWFHNAVRNLTLDVGSGNPGAVALRFYSNNWGWVRDVTLRSGDGAATLGLDLGTRALNGPLLVKNVSVAGFVDGIRTADGINSQTLDIVTVSGVSRYGLVNRGQTVNARRLTITRNSTTPTPAILNEGHLTLITASLSGTGDASLINTGKLSARDVKATTFTRAIDNQVAGGTASPTGLSVTQFSSHAITRLGGTGSGFLRLPVKETPAVAWDALSTWKNVKSFGATGDGPSYDIQYRGGDGFGYDSGGWAQARVEGPNGTRFLAGNFNDGYAGGPSHTLVSDELGWFDRQFQYEWISMASSTSPINLRGQTYTRGIRGSWSTLKWNLGGAYTRFKSVVGVRDETGGRGSIDFEVWGDGRKLFDSGILYGTSPAKNIDIDISGVGELHLVINGGEDDTRGLQAAIDSGATTVYLPAGSYTVSAPLILRGAVKRLIGTRAIIRTRNGPATLRVENGSATTVAIEGIEGPRLENATSRTVVVQNGEFSSYESVAGGTGEVFLEDLAIGPMIVRAQKVWARQLDCEVVGDNKTGPHILNDGGTLWVLGFKTEGGGTLIETRNGSTEVLGAHIYTTSAPNNNADPMFSLVDSRASFVFNESNFAPTPYTTYVRETRGGLTRDLPATALLPHFGSGRATTLFAGH